ncbi:MAG: zinc-dependent alcohol dehydrogenase family protein [Gammaproteobacteria bacterium]
MRAMLLEQSGQPLQVADIPKLHPGPGQVRLKVNACGVCRTDLHVCDGELTEPKLPLVLGHEIVAQVETVGEGVTNLETGMRVGVPWLGHTCQHCEFCDRNEENLCMDARFTGYNLDGGYAEYTLADSRYCFLIPEQYDDAHAAPLLCAGLIGYRAWRMAGEVQRLGLYGFGAAAHILAQIAVYHGQEVYAFTRSGDNETRTFARELGAVWAGDSKEQPPVELDATIIFAPVGDLVPRALSVTRRGGSVVCAGIHMSDIPSFPYSLLWGERVLRSVANLTRADGLAFMELAARIPIRTHVERFALEQANQALEKLRKGQLIGAAVLIP